jgi:SpoVK/Ycf46/Vps4 family AAA+-type ATPase
MSKLAGESESNMRKAFEEAEKNSLNSLAVTMENCRASEQ